MPKEKSKPPQAMDEVLAALHPLLQDLDFRARSKAFNRATPDGRKQVIEFQFGRFDPPGTHYVGFRQAVFIP